MKRVGAVVAAWILLLSLLLAGSAQADTIVYVQGGWLRMRAAPDFGAQTIASYYTGTALSLKAAMGSWSYVQAQDGKQGYMYSTYLTTTPPGTPEPLPGSTTGYVYAANGRGVRLRQGPGTNYGVIGLYNVGTKVTVLSKGASWHYIQIGKQAGYMMAQYIVDTSPSPEPGPGPVPGPGYTAYVYASNGLPVNLREGAGKSYHSIAKLPVGTMVTVLTHGTAWDYIQTGTQQGYMMNKYLKTGYPPAPSPSVTITGVSVSSLNPTPGQILSAVVSPAGATCTYKWYNDLGTHLSSGATYTVQNSDVGRRILVTVTGSGSTKGYASSTYTNTVASGSSSVTTPLTAVTIDNAYPRVGNILFASVQPAGATATYLWYRDDGVLLSGSSTCTVQMADMGHRIYCVATGLGNYTGTVVSSFTSHVSSVTTDQPMTGTVSLPAAVTVGSNLAPTMVLATTNVTYAWQADGMVVGSAPSLFVTEALTGKSLRLTVTAVSGSGFSGSVSSGVCQVKSGFSPATSTDIYP